MSDITFKGIFTVESFSSAVTVSMFLPNFYPFMSKFSLGMSPLILISFRARKWGEVDTIIDHNSLYFI